MLGENLISEVGSAFFLISGESRYSMSNFSDNTMLIKKNTSFYENCYWVRKNREDDEINADDYKRRFIYKKIGEEYTGLKFYLLDIDKYLGIENCLNSGNEVIDSMIDMTKSYYAETRLALSTKAVFWNVYRSGIGNATLELLCDEDL